MARWKVLFGASSSLAALVVATAAAEPAGPSQGSRPVTRASFAKPGYKAAPVAAANPSSTAAPAPASSPSPAPASHSTSASAPATEMEMNEQIVTDFLRRKDRAEKAQRAILAELRKELDRRRAEFEEARKKFDEARGRYSEIVGPLPKQGIMNPADPRLPYEFEVRRSWPEPGESSKAGQISQQPGGGVIR